MPNTIVKFTMFFESDAAYGWSESHFLQVGSANPNLSVQLQNFVTQIATPRAACLGHDSRIEFCRASYVRNGAIASLPQGTLLPGEPSVTGSDSASSLAVLMFNATNNSKKVIHMRGYWDGAVEDEVFNNTTPVGAAWFSRFLTFKAALVANSYGWPSKDPALSVKGGGVTYTENPDGTVLFTFPAAGPTIPDPGGNGTLEIRFSGFNNRNSILNRQILCKWDNPLQVTSVRQIGAGPIQNAGKFNYRVATFNTYSDFAKITAGERRMGRPSGRYPGRHRVTPLY